MLCTSPNGTFQIEEKCREVTPGIRTYQTWLVPINGQPVQLPEITFPGKHYYPSATSAELFGSTYFISPDEKYIARSQKIVHGVAGLYLYQQQSGVEYKIANANLYTPASAVAAKRMHIHWDNRMGPDASSETGFVNPVGWVANNKLLLTVSGFANARKKIVNQFEMYFDPDQGVFSESDEQMAKNRLALQNPR